MAKKTKGKNRGEAQVKKLVPKFYPVPLPLVLSRDELAEKTDDQLADMLDGLHQAKEFVIQTDKTLSVTPWEVEICYTHRELGARIGRRQAHERYLGKAVTPAVI